MATFKLGAIITDMQGSISGTTIRRTPNGHIMYNKQGTQIKSAFAPASKKNKIANIFRGWGELSKEQQDKWKDNAKLYPVKDKYGETKILSGRQLYTKLNTQLLPIGLNSNEKAFDTFVENPAIVIGECNTITGTFEISWGGTFTSQYILVSIYRIRKKGSVKPHAHFKRSEVKPVTNSDSIDIYTAFTNTFPLAQIGEEYGVNIQFCNASGIVSSVQAFTFQVLG